MLGAVRFASQTSFYWTFKELKHESTAPSGVTFSVFTEPLRNWNSIGAVALPSEPKVFTEPLRNWNKSSLISWLISSLVFTEPLRNWNQQLIQALFMTWHVFTEPLRNWNTYRNEPMMMVFRVFTEPLRNWNRRITIKINNNIFNLVDRDINVYAYREGDGVNTLITTQDITGNNNIFIGDNNVSFRVIDNNGLAIADINVSYELQGGTPIFVGQTNSDGMISNYPLSFPIDLLDTNIDFIFTFPSSYGLENNEIVISKKIISGYYISTYQPISLVANITEHNNGMKTVEMDDNSYAISKYTFANPVLDNIMMVPLDNVNYFNIQSVSSVVRFLTISDVLIISGFGLIAPIFAVFITDTITGGTVAVVGVAATIYLITRSIGQIPLAALIDRIKGERDDFWFMFFGSIGISLVPLLYLVIQTPLQLYGVQFLYGLFGAIVFPSWMAIFTRHIDKGKEGIEWGVYQTLVDLGSATTALIGGFIAFRFGFDNLFNP